MHYLSGLGLRTEFLRPLSEVLPPHLGFIELAPENWLGIGGWRTRALAKLSTHYPVFAHGLHLSLGSVQPLDKSLLQQLKQFFIDYPVQHYSEHLSYCNDAQGYLYELLPIPFTEETVRHISQRIAQVQDFLGRRIAVENPTYYYVPTQEMTEIVFINAILMEADCDLLLDVNNLYVNSMNHDYNAEDFIACIPTNKLRYLHLAGHSKASDEILIDTHGDTVPKPVWQLFHQVCQYHGPRPTLLERDQNIPPLAELLQEISQINTVLAHYDKLLIS